MRLERSFPIKQYIMFKVHLLSSVHAHCTNGLSIVDMQGDNTIYIFSSEHVLSIARAC